jgi:N utilization substance protein A
VSLAIGKGGYNIKLAGKLTGYEIDVYRDSDVENEDVDLQEFGDEIEQWIIDALLAIGCDTAKSVLNLSIEDIMKRADLDEETVLDIRRILEEEFES